MNNTLLTFSVLFLVVASHQCYAAPDGQKENDKIDKLPGQPEGVGFNQYSGYVKVDPGEGKSFFYYFVESYNYASSKPLVLWFSGGISCSSIGVGAFTEIGPFTVNQDRKTLHLNQYAWTREANVLFVETSVGIGFSYSNKSSDYKRYGDTIAACDTYAFLINWLQRFPEYKQSDVFLAGEGYAGHNAINLGQLILQKSKHSYHQNKINLKGIALGNAFIDRESSFYGSIEYAWSHALISEELYSDLISSCDRSSFPSFSEKCYENYDRMFNLTMDINPYDIHSPLCNSTAGSNPYEYQGPCSTDYVSDYFNNPAVQTALHADAPHPWKLCNISGWTDYQDSVLPYITQLMKAGIQVFIYSGDADLYTSVPAARNAIRKLGLSVATPWYPWYSQNQVGGYAVEYNKNLVFATVRGGGHFVPASQPARALALFASFVNGSLPPSK